jgi:hypothetical protein
LSGPSVTVYASRIEAESVPMSISVATAPVKKVTRRSRSAVIADAVMNPRASRSLSAPKSRTASQQGAAGALMIASRMIDAIPFSFSLALSVFSAACRLIAWQRHR